MTLALHTHPQAAATEEPSVPAEAAAYVPKFIKICQFHTALIRYATVVNPIRHKPVNAKALGVNRCESIQNRHKPFVAMIIAYECCF